MGLNRDCERFCDGGSAGCWSGLDRDTGLVGKMPTLLEVGDEDIRADETGHYDSAARED